MPSVYLGDQYTGLRGQILALTLSISDFTMHLIISKWLRRQKMQIVEKKYEKKRG